MDVYAGQENQEVRFAAFTATGAAVTVTSATAGLSLWYRRDGGAKVSLTPITDLATLETAHTDKAILVIAGQEHRLDLPDAAFAAGAKHVCWGGSATGITIDGGEANIIGQAGTATDTSEVNGVDADDAIQTAAEAALEADPTMNKLDAMIEEAS